MTELASFLLIPAADDDLAATLRRQVGHLAARRCLAYDRRGLEPALARRLAAHQRAAIADRAGFVARFADHDLTTCALALADDPAIAADAAATLCERLERATRFDDGVAIAPQLPALQLATRDRNPLRGLEAHPDKTGNALDLGGQPTAAWLAALTTALDAIAAALPTLHRELSVTLERIVPVGFDRERHLSCSYREAPGLVYLSLHPDPLTLAEAIVHETQHGKLNLLSWLDPLLTNHDDQRVASPARPDPRPLFGVLLAAHAFVAVAALHHALAAIDHPLAHGPAFARRRAQVHSGNAEAIVTLAQHARPSAVGARVLEAITNLHHLLGDARNG